MQRFRLDQTSVDQNIAAFEHALERIPTSNSLDPANWDELRKQAHRMLDDMLGYLETIRDRPVWQVVPEEVRAQFRGPLPPKPATLASIHDQFMTSILPFTAANTHPGFFGWVQGGGTPVGMLAEMLAAGLNANVGGRDQIPLEVEAQVTRWMRSLFGFPAEASGIFLTGTSMANFVAVVIARDRHLGLQVRREGLGIQTGQFTAYASAAAHGSIAKALDLAGLGSASLRIIPIDQNGRINVTYLAQAIKKDRSSGFTPFLVVGTAGTVDTGAIDDLSELAYICAEETIWFHVDGAFGALAMLSPLLAPKLKGIESADSLAFDFHKWAQVPYDAGFLLVRDGKSHRDAFGSSGAYLVREPRGMAAGSVWPCDLGPELSRSFRALKVWTTFNAYGADAIGSMIYNTCELAHYLKARVEALSELELLASVDLNVVCFRYRFPPGIIHMPEKAPDHYHDSISNQLNRELAIRLQESGAVAPSTTTLQGQVAIRAAIVNHRTTRAELDMLVEATLSIGRELSSKAMLSEDIEWYKGTLTDCEQRLAQLDQHLAIRPQDETEVELRVRRAMLLTQLGRSLDARSDHLRVLELAPQHRTNLLELGRLLVRTGQLKAAQVVYAEAVKYYPDDIVSRVNLGSVRLQRGDILGAQQQYEAALRLDPELPEAHGGLYYVLDRLGHANAAAQHQRKAFGSKNLFRSPYRGAGPSIPVLLLVSSTGGNIPIEKLLDDTIFETYVLVTDFFDPTETLPHHHLVLNGIGDVDVAKNALRSAEALLKQSSASILNAPRAVLASSRCENAQRFAKIPGLRTARTVAYAQTLLASESGAKVLQRDGFTFPLLLRVPGLHMGQHFVRVTSSAALTETMSTLPGSGGTDSELLAIEYLDARGGEDTCFRKYRVMIVDGQLYPLHLAISSNWKVHYFSADMTDHADHRAEEARFLEDMLGVLGPKAMAALYGIKHMLGLDYGGIDFGLSRLGEVLLFEANATMVVEHPDDDNRWDYRRDAVDKIHAAVRRMLERRSRYQQHASPVALPT